MESKFDEIIDRTNQLDIKWGQSEKVFGSIDVLPMWIADMDFASPKPVLDALKSLLDSRILGYTAPPDTLYQAIIDWQKERHHMEIGRASCRKRGPSGEW